MTGKPRDRDPIPETFASYEAAGEFWDSHDTTDYPDDFETVEVETDLRLRHLEVTLDPELTARLRSTAAAEGVSVAALATEYLRRGLERAA